MDEEMGSMSSLSGSSGSSSGGGVAGGISSIGTMITSAADTTSKNIDEALYYKKLTLPQHQSDMKTAALQRTIMQQQIDETKYATKRRKKIQNLMMGYEA
jgi:hypothetical protein